MILLVVSITRESHFPEWDIRKALFRVKINRWIVPIISLAPIWPGHFKCPKLKRDDPYVNPKCTPKNRAKPRHDLAVRLTAGSSHNTNKFQTQPITIHFYTIQEKLIYSSMLLRTINKDVYPPHPSFIFIFPCFTINSVLIDISRN